MLKSFSYMFRENDFWKKFLLIYVFVFIANILINFSSIFIRTYEDNFILIISNVIFFLGYIVLLVPYGYFVNALKDELCTNTDVLRNINIISDFKAGFRFMLSLFILYIPLVLMFALFIILNGILFKGENSVVNYIGHVLSMLIFFVVTFIAVPMLRRYAEHRNFLSFVDFKSAINMIKNKEISYLKLYAVLLAISILIYFVSFVVFPAFLMADFLGLFIYALLLSGVWTYFVFVFIKLFACKPDIDKI